MKTAYDNIDNNDIIYERVTLSANYMAEGDDKWLILSLPQPIQ